MNTRVIHIEVAYTLASDSFILMLQRFINRRGRPVSIRSDNGTNFAGGHAEFKTAARAWNQEKINSFLKQKDVQ